MVIIKSIYVDPHMQQSLDFHLIRFLFQEILSAIGRTLQYLLSFFLSFFFSFFPNSVKTYESKGESQLRVILNPHLSTL